MKVSPPLAIALLIGIISSPASDERSGWMPFVVPAMPVEGSPIDLSFLNPEPAGASGPLRAEGERVIDGKGREVRLFGTNVCDFHAMPPKDLAPKIALRLRQLGFNFVRLHYYDWDVAPSGMLLPDRQSLDPNKLDEFHFFIAALKENGIYVDINLHVARRYPGLPESWNWMGKSIDKIHAPFVESQKQFARDVLSPKNPYTGLSLAHDPAVAVVELNNENSVLQSERVGLYAGMGKEFSEPIRAAWNAWLKKHYQTTEALSKAWGSASEELGPELLDGDLKRWDVEALSGGMATSSVKKEETEFLQWEATRAGSNPWDLAIHRLNVPVAGGKSYVFSFQARAPQGGAIVARLMQQGPPWQSLGLNRIVQLSPEWKTYRIGWHSGDPGKVPVRLSFESQNMTGVFDFRNFSLREGRLQPLETGESLEEGTISLLANQNSPVRFQDYVTFLADWEIEVAKDLKNYIKNDLGFASLVWDSQANYGGAGGFRREATVSDALDIHGYPAHPEQGPRQPDGGFLWGWKDASLLGKAFGELEVAAAYRAAGKPFFLTEYDLNPPNVHADESFPVFSLMAAYQGWAGICDYAWLNFQRGDENPNRIRSMFGTTGYAGQMATIPVSALFFRLGLVKPASTRSVLRIGERAAVLSTTRDASFQALALDRERAGGHRADAWALGLATELVEGDTIELASQRPTPEGDITTSDTGQITLDRTPGKEQLRVNAPALRYWIGQIRGRDWQTDDVSFRMGSSHPESPAQISLVSLDGSPLSSSPRLLLTVLGRVENIDWKPASPIVMDQLGRGPTVAEPILFQAQLPGNQWKVTTLDGNGLPTKTTNIADGNLDSAKIGPAVWFLLERGDGSAVNAE